MLLCLSLDTLQHKLAGGRNPLLQLQKMALLSESLGHENLQELWQEGLSQMSKTRHVAREVDIGIGINKILSRAPMGHHVQTAYVL